MSDLIKEIKQGERAKELLHDILEPYFRNREAELYAEFCTCDDANLIKIKNMQNALTEIKREIKDYINTGNLATIQFKELNHE